MSKSYRQRVYCQFLLSVHVGDTDNTIVSCMAFGIDAERIAKLGKGDAVSVTGSLKPSEWADKATGEIKHGLSVTVSGVLSVYDIQKRRRTDTNSTKLDAAPYSGLVTFDDPIDF